MESAMATRLTQWQIYDKASRIRESLRGMAPNDRMEIIGHALHELTSQDVSIIHEAINSGT
ncbi:hypothetical protein [Escherichia phage LHE71]|uniref:Uncharacterized protein n=1 Tax=Escherichia phage LHE71 TaxID=2982898 RepID=A0A9X9P190_9CAUD|nr:hypothetical protein [Escherichia phage LHE71]